MDARRALDSLFFVELPQDFQLSKKAFPLKKGVPLPVQKKSSDFAGSFDMAELSAEQILSGILTVLAYDSKNENAPYYREVLLSARPNIKTELSQAAIVKTKNEDFDLAEEIYLALKGIDPNDAAIVLNEALFFDLRAQSYRRSGLNDDADACDELALKNYKTAMESEPPASDAFFNAGFFYLERRDFLNARDCFESFLALTCEDCDDDLDGGGAYKKERALEILNEIKSQNMDDARFKNARELILAGREEKALGELRAFLEKNQDVWNAWFMLGWALRRLQRYDDALAAFKKAQELGCENCESFNEISLCLMALGDLEGAEKNLLSALSKNAEDTKVISNLGFVALKRGLAEKASKYFETVLEFDPNDKIAKDELEKLRAAKM